MKSFLHLFLDRKNIFHGSNTYCVENNLSLPILEMLSFIITENDISWKICFLKEWNHYYPISRFQISFNYDKLKLCLTPNKPEIWCLEFECS